MAQRAQIHALELIGQAVNVDQIAQAHPIILGRVGTGMPKGVEAAERPHRLAIEFELLAELPRQRKAGKWRAHIREGPVQIDPLKAGCPLASQ